MFRSVFRLTIIRARCTFPHKGCWGSVDASLDPHIFLIAPRLRVSPPTASRLAARSGDFPASRLPPEKQTISCQGCETVLYLFTRRLEGVRRAPGSVEAVPPPLWRRRAPRLAFVIATTPGSLPPAPAPERAMTAFRRGSAKTVARRPEMAPQDLENIDSSPGNGRALDVSNPQCVATRAPNAGSVRGSEGARPARQGGGTPPLLVDQSGPGSR